ncbi:secondary thiamine-phosphate synthase enzyme [Desulfatibacillum alkenivorans DSM 16219]|uniref:Secondary thiamine-phosphate synthase enzyme n=2 Tax=Desulfatibacillum alkenivorans TaxID=259354 RepID=A0A1M6SB26_9BACT|nr:secondary thiamine-phosphate synthase enzyme YjbQ [Desulfatibacillum alkenivorans]SHK41890.1 secondary thiamine-phosphate synthase enzyme [Desulfatibacillum alkenivorans DSM 16219]
MQFTVSTRSRTEMVDITSRVQDFVREEGVQDGAVMVFVPHTTAGVTINESADPDVARDIIMALNILVPGDLDYRHAEGNSPAHIKSSMMGSSVLVEVSGGRLVLGTWQGVFFCEFDGPRTRKVRVVAL